MHARSTPYQWSASARACTNEGSVRARPGDRLRNRTTCIGRAGSFSSNFRSTLLTFCCVTALAVAAPARAPSGPNSSPPSSARPAWLDVRVVVSAWPSSRISASRMSPKRTKRGLTPAWARHSQRSARSTPMPEPPSSATNNWFALNPVATIDACRWSRALVLSPMVRARSAKAAATKSAITPITTAASIRQCYRKAAGHNLAVSLRACGRVITPVSRLQEEPGGQRRWHPRRAVAPGDAARGVRAACGRPARPNPRRIARG
jgi:hypothetical protein